MYRAGRMVGAGWTADSRGLILGWECAAQLAELRLTRPAPHLDAQLWLLQTPELPARLGSGETSFWVLFGSSCLTSYLRPRHPLERPLLGQLLFPFASLVRHWTCCMHLALPAA